MVIKMIYKIGMLCKHFKGDNLLEKNIYRIVALNVNGESIDSKEITYTGEGTLNNAKNLVIYANIFQNNKLFAREYDDISTKMTLEKQEIFHQERKVEPLTLEEIALINTTEFQKEKEAYTQAKLNKQLKKELKI